MLLALSTTRLRPMWYQLADPDIDPNTRFHNVLLAISKDPMVSEDSEKHPNGWFYCNAAAI